MTDAFLAPHSADGPRIVGIGASAGGLIALEQFFKAVYPDTQMAYVVVQHTSPQYKTFLGALLQRITTLPVHDAQNGVVVKANAIYIMPTSGKLTIERGRLHFLASHKPISPHLPIDDFLVSLAEDQGQRAVGVILSGMGHDGAKGLLAIHNAGGYCIAQHPDTAAFATMPQSAIDAACVHVVAAPEDMPMRIAQWSSNTQAGPTTSIHLSQATTALATTTHSDGLQSILELLHDQLHHDFSLYKTSSLQRRIERRLHVHQLPSIAAYNLFLINNPRELGLLFAELLIGVTSFFRDAPMWLDLSMHVVPKLLKAHVDRPVRVWVLGCSTGEEAYTLAMLCLETPDMPGQPRRAIQIYATDLNPVAIGVARKGWYNAATLAPLTSAQRDRFFTPQHGGFKVRPELRSLITFAQHDVISDPPFTRLDLLLCRNVLIYFNSTLQRRLMPLFHFSLNTGGLLVLGSAETAGGSQNLFNVLMPKSRIYGRVDQIGATAAVALPVHRNTKAPLGFMKLPKSSSLTPPMNSLQFLADQVLLQTISHAAVLVNSSGDILYTSGRVDLYLEPVAGKANWNIHVMAQPTLRAPVARALRQALQGGLPVLLSQIYLGETHQRPCEVTVLPLDEPEILANTAMVIFKDLETLIFHEDESDELQSSHSEMQILHGEMQTSQEQLSTINKSLEIANEVLQSANEKMQTRLDDLTLAQSDVQNLLNSTDTAALFLDKDLNVRCFTDKAEGIFHLHESDVGRSLGDLANFLSYPLLQCDVQTTLRTLTPCSQSVVATDGRWFSVRIMPLRTLADSVSGAVLTIADISPTKALDFRWSKNHLPVQFDKD